MQKPSTYTIDNETQFGLFREWWNKIDDLFWKDGKFFPIVMVFYFRLMIECIRLNV